MRSGDWFSDRHKVFNLYCSKNVIESFKNNIKKLLSEFRYIESSFKGVLNNENDWNKKEKHSTRVIEDIQPEENKKSNNTQILQLKISKMEQPSLENSEETTNNTTPTDEKGEEENKNEEPNKEENDVSSESVNITPDQKNDVSSESVNITPDQTNKPAKKNKGKTSGRTKRKSDETKETMGEVCSDDPMLFKKLEGNELNPEISLRVIWKSVAVKKFQIKKFEKMAKVFKEISASEDIPQDKIILVFNDKKVSPNDTPYTLNLQKYNFIDGEVVNEPTCSYEASIPTTSSEENSSITLKFQDCSGKIMKLTLNKTDAMKIALIKYAEQLEISSNKIKFYFDGELVDSSETPASLGLDNDDVIDINVLP